MEKLNVEKIREDFPILNQEVNNNPLAYLDSAATTQKPLSVIRAMEKYNRSSNANIHRGAYTLSIKATEEYDKAREKVRDFINSPSTSSIIFTKNTTEAINLVAFSYGLDNIGEGDEIVVLITEHHSNILPWQMLVQRNKAILKFVYLNEEGLVDMNDYKEKVTDKTKLIATGHISNALGTINPVKEIIEYGHEKGAIVLIDGAQAVPHMKVDIQELDPDFYVFSGHKMLGPMGIGILYGRKEILESMSPFLSGGDMIEYVEEQSSTYGELPYKFEAGTQNVEAAVGLKSAIEYLEDIGLENIKKHEMKLTQYALERMKEIPYVTIYGPENIKNRSSVISFNIDDVHPHDVATILDSYGVAVRAGHHCAQPLMKHLGINATCRASFYLYNTIEEVDQFIESLKNVRKWLGYGS
ncbi:cysteine desulfurase [Clostridium sp. D2Q-11]|uniref:cysteine desulfurase n=1 Tax=Anaeromonas frigoriresistens TaxID=2683708 RepID=A0A942Z684_9FIRM|nr:cysteine desulfurase [Anaeromonas frigoriresistens]MBS4537307.1 cysteine desulfurase [Anaeromonas frigoriresistens]